MNTGHEAAISPPLAGGTSHDFPDAHAGPLLVHLAGTDSGACCAGHANVGYSDCGL